MKLQNRQLLSIILATAVTFGAGQVHADSSDKDFTGILIQQPLTAAQLVQLTSQDEDHMQGSIHVPWYKDGEDMQKQAKISRNKAVALAVKTGLGKVVKAELEGEEGFLTWEIKILGTHNEKYKLWLDAGTGKAMFIKIKDLKHDDD